jgi:hypothetical protein
MKQKTFDASIFMAIKAAGDEQIGCPHEHVGRCEECGAWMRLARLLQRALDSAGEARRFLKKRGAATSV